MTISIPPAISPSTDSPDAEGPDPFARVPEPLKGAIQKKGFEALTPVQDAALDAVDAGRDLRITSQTGSGKTVALGLAISAELLDADEGAKPAPGSRVPGPRAIVVVPTRELAAQVQKELKWLYAGVKGVNVHVVTGGTAVGPERAKLARGPRILVGTPGRLCDHIRSGALVTDQVHQFVLDEADQMLDLGFKDELDAIADALPKEGLRTHLMSATFSRDVKSLADRMQDDPLHLEGTRLGQANADIEHILHRVHADDRYGALVNLLLMAGSGKQSLVFVATRNQTVEVAEQLERDGFRALPISGELPQLQRTRTLDGFRSGKVQVLVATDVAARGIDVPELSMVVHFDMPMDAEIYTHRSGRSGRAGNKGRSVLFATPRSARRAMQLTNRAKVDAQWQPLPTAAEIQGELDGRLHSWLRGRVHDGSVEPSAAARKLARELVAAAEPVDAVAHLVEMVLQDALPREPFDVRSPEFSPERGAPLNPKKGRGPRMHRGDRHDNGAGFTCFRINWGFKQGANHGRILAAVCRRGDVSSHQIGRISIGPREATFDVAESAAPGFEKSARRPDKRDPQQRIERHAGGHIEAPPYGGGSGRPFKKGPGFGGKKKQKGFRQGGAGA